MAASTPKPQDVVGSGRWGRYLLWSSWLPCGRPVEGLWTGGGVGRGGWSPGEGRRGGAGGGREVARGGVGREAFCLPGVAADRRAWRPGPKGAARPPAREAEREASVWCHTLSVNAECSYRPW